jgi:hypothetical protein
MVRVPSESHEKAQAEMGLSLSSLAAAISKAVDAVTRNLVEKLENHPHVVAVFCCFDRREYPSVDAVTTSQRH